MYKYDPMMEIRTALTTTTSTTGGDSRTNVGGVEIQKLIDRMITENINVGLDLRPLVARRPIPAGNRAYFWNIRADLGYDGSGTPNLDKAAFYSDGGGGTPQPSRKIQLFATAVSWRADYEVTGLMVASWGLDSTALADEAKAAVQSLGLLEERSMICGSDTSAYGHTSAFDGLLQLMGSNATFGDTDTIFGTARGSDLTGEGGTSQLDVSLVAAGATSTDALTLADLDSAITASNKAGGKGKNRIFFCSEERGDEISQLLQPQQRFVAGAGLLEIEGGFSVLHYKRIRIVTSRFMDKNGITWNGSSKTKAYADNSMYLLDLDEIEMRILGGVDAQNVPINGADANQRNDVRGGYIKTYGVFVMKKFRTSVLIYNLTAP